MIKNFAFEELGRLPRSEIQTGLSHDFPSFIKPDSSQLNSLKSFTVSNRLM
jgi:hypothetical protein